MRFFLEVNDEPEEALPFDDGEKSYYCPKLEMFLTEYQLGQLDPVTEEDRMVRVLGRNGILREADAIVNGKREEYGEPEDSFGGIASLWSAYLTALFRRDLEIAPSNAAVMMILLKIARTVDACKLDNYIDMAGYAACAGELEEKSL